MSSSSPLGWTISCRRESQCSHLLYTKADDRIHRFCAVEAIVESVSEQNVAKVDSMREGQVNGESFPLSLI